MYLSDRALKFAVETGQLIVDPAPTEYDTTSIDLHLDNVNIIVSTISSPPTKRKKEGIAIGQREVSGNTRSN
jgi:hypothetical protein